MPRPEATAAPAQAAAPAPALTRKASKSPRPSAEQTVSSSKSPAPSADGAPLNVLRVTLHPVGAGTYPSKVVLASGGDTRVLDIEFVATKSGQQVALEFNSPARDKMVQEVSCYAYAREWFCHQAIPTRGVIKDIHIASLSCTCKPPHDECCLGRYHW